MYTDIKWLESVTCCVVNFNTPGEQVEILSLLKLIGELPQRMEIDSEIKA